VTTQIEEERKLKLPRPPKPKLPEPPYLPLPGQTVATNLSAQLGSDAKVLSLGEFDMRRLSYIDEQQLQALAYFSWRGQKVRFWKHPKVWWDPNRGEWNFHADVELKNGGKLLLEVSADEKQKYELLERRFLVGTKVHIRMSWE